MGKQSPSGDLLRQRLKAEREHLGWSQERLAQMVSAKGFPMHWTTVAKIENADRSVRADELGAFAELFGVSTDALLGRSSGSSDVMWAASRLTSDAQKVAGEVVGLRDRVYATYEDLFNYAKRDRQTDTMRPLLDRAELAIAHANVLREALVALANEFPLPGKMS